MVDGTLDLLRLHPNHYTGMISEYRAAVYYLENGYQVYWPAIQQSVVDFIIEKDKEFQKVQVKTASWNRAGPNSYLQCRTHTKNKYSAVDGYDILFIISDIGYWEIPTKLIRSTNLCLHNTGRNRCQWKKFKVKEVH